jgi:hypothetical protein
MSRSFGKNRDEVLRQLDLLGASSVVISSNLQTRLDGLPYAKQREPEDAGVAVYFMLDGNQQCIPWDKWDTTAQNLRAIALTIDALRGIERWGAKEMVNAAFRGFKALPASIITPPPSTAWYTVLGLSPDASREEIKTAYRRLAHATHPDTGGDNEQFARISKAYHEGFRTLMDRGK